MLDFLRDLLIGEAHQDPYVWSAVMLAHAMIGAALFIAIGIVVAALMGDAWAGVILVVLTYWAFETLQILRGAPFVDSLLDWSAVALGAVAAMALWTRHGRHAALALAGLVAVLLAGVLRRLRGRP